MCVETTDFGWLLVAVCTNVVVIGTLVLCCLGFTELAIFDCFFLVRLAFLFDDWGLGGELGHRFADGSVIAVTVAVTYDTAAAKDGGFGSVGKSSAIGAFAAQDGRFVFIPIILLPFEATVLCPEEEPNCTEDERYAYQSKDGLDAFHIDVIGIDGAGGRVDGAGRLRRISPSERASITLEDVAGG